MTDTIIRPPFRTVHTRYSDRPGSCRTLATDHYADGGFVETFEITGMTSGYGDFFLEIRRIKLPLAQQWQTEGRLAARIGWAESQQVFADAWAKRRPKFPDDVHAAACHLFPFLKED